MLMMMQGLMALREGPGQGGCGLAALSAVTTLLLTLGPTVNRKEAGGISSHVVSEEGTLTIFHLVAKSRWVWSLVFGP